ncbi:MAG: META domain-containing protein, partial [Methanoculleus sp.]
TGTTVTAIFDADGIRVSGLAGCNHYSADYTRNGADITIKSAVRTDMYCGEPEGLMDQEDRYLSLLTDVSSYWVEGDRLILSDKEGAALLVLDRAAEVPDLPLVGTDWVLDSYSTGRDAISSVITGTTITAKFTDDSKITGSAGCNHYGGEYLLDGANLSVSSLFSTLMYCGEPEGVMEQEARYLGLFDSVTGYRIDGDRLDLLDEVGKVLLSYRAGCTDQP